MRKQTVLRGKSFRTWGGRALGNGTKVEVMSTGISGQVAASAFALPGRAIISRWTGGGETSIIFPMFVDVWGGTVAEWVGGAVGTTLAAGAAAVFYISDRKRERKAQALLVRVVHEDTSDQEKK